MGKILKAFFLYCIGIIVSYIFFFLIDLLIASIGTYPFDVRVNEVLQSSIRCFRFPLPFACYFSLPSSSGVMYSPSDLSKVGLHFYFGNLLVNLFLFVNYFFIFLFWAKTKNKQNLLVGSFILINLILMFFSKYGQMI